MPLPRTFARMSGVLISLALALPWAGAQGGERQASFLAASAAVRSELARLDADPARADEMYAREAGARAELKSRLLTLLGPMEFRGLRPDPAFSPDSLFPDTQVAAYGTPEGLLFTDADDATRLFVTPEPVLADWLRRASADTGAPPAFARGLPAAMGAEQIAFSVLQNYEGLRSVSPPAPAPAGGRDAASALWLCRPRYRAAPPAQRHSRRPSRGGALHGGARLSRGRRDAGVRGLHGGL